MTDQLRAHYLGEMEQSGADLDNAPWGSDEEGPLRVDREVDPGVGTVELSGGRVQVHRFDGHIPGHLCVLVDSEHLITGDMWLPATTSLVTPGSIADQAEVPARHCGVLEYVAS